MIKIILALILQNKFLWQSFCATNKDILRIFLENETISIIHMSIEKLS